MFTFWTVIGLVFDAYFEPFLYHVMWWFLCPVNRRSSKISVNEQMTWSLIFICCLAALQLVFPSANANLIDIKIYWSSLGARQRHRDREDDREIWISGVWSAGVDWANHHHPQQPQVCKLSGWSPAAASGLQHLPDSRETAQVSVCHKHTTHSNTPEINWITLSPPSPQIHWEGQPGSASVHYPEQDEGQ